MPLLYLHSEQWPLWYRESNQERTSTNSPPHPFTYQHLHPAFLLCLPSSKLSVHPIKVHPSTLLTGSIFYHQIKGIILVILPFISYMIKFSLYWTFPAAHKHTVMSPVPKKVPLLTSFLPPASILGLCSPLSQNSLKELSTLTSLILLLSFSPKLSPVSFGPHHSPKSVCRSHQWPSCCQTPKVNSQSPSFLMNQQHLTWSVTPPPQSTSSLSFRDTCFLVFLLPHGFLHLRLCCFSPFSSWPALHFLINNLGPRHTH